MIENLDSSDEQYLSTMPRRADRAHEREMYDALYGQQSPRRRYYYVDDDEDDDHHAEKLPVISSPQYVYLSPRRREASVRYATLSPIVEYVYDEDDDDHEEVVEYIPRKRKLIRRMIFEDDSFSVAPSFISDSGPSVTRESVPLPRLPTKRPPPPAVVHQNKPSGLTLKQIVARNRARRARVLPQVRREVYEDTYHDRPLRSKTIVQNGFIVHK